MRVSTAFNTMLAVPEASVTTVEFTPAGTLVHLRRRRRWLTCPCGWSARATYDRSVRRWRHLDLGSSRLFLVAEVRRLECRRCRRVRTETVPWARPGARHSRDFEDVVAWLAQRTDKTTITRLLRCSWEAVARIVVRVVAGAIDERRLDGIFRIGVDEVSYRKGHRYLTVVADHDRAGAVVWAGEGRNAETLSAFYNELGPRRRAQLQAVSMDMGGAFAKATRDHVPHARQCIDPFHVIQLANQAIDKLRRQVWNQYRDLRLHSAAWMKHTRWALLKDPTDLKPSQRVVLRELRQRRHALWRAYVLKEELRDLYRLPEPAIAAYRLDRWLARACRSRLQPIVDLARTLRSHREGIIAACELGLSNSKLEGLNSKIRLINHRGYGHRSLPALIAMIYLCCGGISVTLPMER